MKNRTDATMEDLLSLTPDARITIFRNDYYVNGSEKPPVPTYQVILGWDYGKIKTADGIELNSFVEAFGFTIGECIEQLKKDINNITI